MFRNPNIPLAPFKGGIRSGINLIRLYEKLFSLLDSIQTRRFGVQLSNEHYDRDIQTPPQFCALSRFTRTTVDGL